MERQLVEFPFQSLQVLDIGRLMGLAHLPVLAGDSIEMQCNALVKLSPLRRPLSADVRFDVWAFFCPYRHTYKDQWIDFIEKGGKEAQTFPTVGVDRQFWLQLYNGSYPKHIWADAARIWNRFFRDPSQGEMNEAVPDESVTLRFVGPKIAHLRGWGTAQSQLLDLADAEYKLDASQPSISLFDIQQQKAKGRNQIVRTMVASRYQELMREISGAEIDENIDDVPELVASESHWMSGYDINATAGSDLGSSVGKAVGAVRMRVPRKFFPEAGTLYFFCALRIPPLFQDTVQYLDANFNRPYHVIVPSPDGDVPPVQLTRGDLFAGGGGSAFGYVPAYDHLRCHPSSIHQVFTDQDTGWQFVPAPSTAAEAIATAEYGQLFSSQKQKQAQVNARFDFRGYRPIPASGQSVFGSV